ncbi:MAG: antitoxin, RHH family protein [Elusimicrobiota bacterium]|nr:antitoxin, RHH family protein [Elusimicrobiota bacterium]
MIHPRIICSVERPLYNMLVASAKTSGMSISFKARCLLLKAIELEEDEALLQTARQRDATWDSKKALSHKEFWGRAPKKRVKKCSH